MAQDPTRCDSCGKTEPVVHFTEMEGDEMKTFHLCAECAAERGVEAPGEPSNAPLADFLAQIGTGVESDRTNGRCPECGMTSAKLRQSGRLGCGTCYTHYEEHLRGLLRRLHGGTTHVGKRVLPPDPDEDDRAAHRLSLRRSLERAIASEDFEHAAALRDQLRELEPGIGGKA
jgi:protein arginine kinase activator